MNSAPKRKMIAASMIGNVLEWYDFAIYGNFAAAIGRSPTSAMQPAGQDPEGVARPKRSQYRSVRGQMPVLSG
jgi:hypothetical protein